MATLHLPGQQWRSAIEAQAMGITGVKQLIHAGHQPGSRLRPLVPTNYANLQLLKASTAYSWGADVTAACWQAAATIPGDVVLDLNLAPVIGPAFFWFDEPLPTNVTKQHNGVAGLLCGFVEQGSMVALSLVSFISQANGVQVDTLDTRGIPSVLPSHQAMWKAGLTLDEMLADNEAEYRRSYGPGGPLAALAPSENKLMGVASTMDTTLKLARFYLAACVWVQQRILQPTDGHIERHRRKQLTRDHGITAPAIRVVELRRTERTRTADDDHQGDGQPVNWTCQWVVGGHMRNQPCGPGKTQRKLIYILPYVKGPEGLPMRQPGRTVFRVDR